MHSHYCKAAVHIFDLGLHNITDTVKKKKKKETCIPQPHVVFNGSPSCCFIGEVLDERTGFYSTVVF